MAQAKTSDASPQNDIDQLSQQIATLKQDIAEISTTLGGLGQSSRDAAVKRARDTAAALKETGEQHMQSAQRHAEEMGQQATDAVRRQPAAAVGIAVGVGFLLGFMTGRK